MAVAKKKKTTPKRKPRTIRTARARKAFLSELRETCNVSHSAKFAKISRRSVYEWRDADKKFAQEWADAEEEAADKLEKIAWDRATVDNSDRMLEILLKAHRPKKFVDRVRAEHSGPDGGPIKQDVDLSVLSTKELKQLADIQSRITKS